MKNLIQNIIPRLKQYSEVLDRKEVFTDKSWTLVDGNSNLQRYIFKRDGQLIMSLKGNVSIGKWEYLSEAKSLLIDRIDDKILLNQDFINQAVMLLRKDGDSESFVLANDSIIKNLDVESYLRQLYRTKNKITTIQLTSGEELEIVGENIAYVGINVTIDGVPAGTNIYHHKNGAYKYHVEKGVVAKIIERTIYNTKRGELIIEKQRNCSPNKGDLAFQNDQPAEGKFNIGIFHHVHIANGVIESSTYF